MGAADHPGNTEYNLDWTYLGSDFDADTQDGDFIHASSITTVQANLDFIKNSLADVTHDSGVLLTNNADHDTTDYVSHENIHYTTEWTDHDTTNYATKDISYNGGLNSGIQSGQHTGVLGSYCPGYDGNDRGSYLSGHDLYANSGQYSGVCAYHCPYYRGGLNTGVLGSEDISLNTSNLSEQKGGHYPGTLSGEKADVNWLHLRFGYCTKWYDGV